MTGALWQDVAVALIAVAALAWLVVRRVRRRREATACEGCPSAEAIPGVRPAPMPEVLMGIGEPADPARRDASQAPASGAAPRTL